MPDPNAAPQPDSVPDPGDTKGSAEQNAKDFEAYVSDIVSRVRGSLGLQEGQDIPSMITGATKRSVSSALGIEKGQDAKEYFAGIMKDALVSNEPDPKPAAKPKPTDELREDFTAMKETLNAMQAEKDAAKKEAHEEKRRGAIRDALGEFELRPEIKNLVTKAFVQGLEGPKADFDEDSNFVVEGDNGHPQPFEAYLNTYFDENRGLLSKPKFTGSGARGKGSAGIKTAFDTTKVHEGDAGGFDKAYEGDPEGTINALAEANADKKAKMGLAL